MAASTFNPGGIHFKKKMKKSTEIIIFFRAKNLLRRV